MSRGGNRFQQTKFVLSALQPATRNLAAQAAKKQEQRNARATQDLENGSDTGNTPDLSPKSSNGVQYPKRTLEPDREQVNGQSSAPGGSPKPADKNIAIMTPWGLKRAPSAPQAISTRPARSRPGLTRPATYDVSSGSASPSGPNPHGRAPKDVLINTPWGPKGAPITSRDSNSAPAELSSPAAPSVKVALMTPWGSKPTRANVTSPAYTTVPAPAFSHNRVRDPGTSVSMGVPAAQQQSSAPPELETAPVPTATINLDSGSSSPLKMTYTVPVDSPAHSRMHNAADSAQDVSVDAFLDDDDFPYTDRPEDDFLDDESRSRHERRFRHDLEKVVRESNPSRRLSSSSLIEHAKMQLSAHKSLANVNSNRSGRSRNISTSISNTMTMTMWSIMEDEAERIAIHSLDQEISKEESGLQPLSGFIEKKSPAALKGWQKRFFVVKENWILWGKNEVTYRKIPPEADSQFFKFCDKYFANRLHLMLVDRIRSIPEGKTHRKFQITARDHRRGAPRHYLWRCQSRQDRDKFVRILNDHKRFTMNKIRWDTSNSKKKMLERAKRSRANSGSRSQSQGATPVTRSVTPASGTEPSTPQTPLGHNIAKDEGNNSTVLILETREEGNDDNAHG